MDFPTVFPKNHVFAEIRFELKKKNKNNDACLTRLRSSRSSYTRHHTCGVMWSVHPSGVAVAFLAGQRKRLVRIGRGVSTSPITTAANATAPPPTPKLPPRARRHISSPRQPPRRRTDRNCCLHGAPSNYAY
uniref:Uncharacterized protein n=1 Tax=Schizaphis graminum TaxID=13262 RepID=A0A2S2NYI1_SCHGA